MAMGNGGGGRGLIGRYPTMTDAEASELTQRGDNNWIIEQDVTTLLKKKGRSRDRAEQYKDATTVSAFLNAGGTLGDLRFNLAHGLCKVTPPKSATNK